MDRSSPVYFDYNATTPLDPEVREVMLPFLGESYGNPSSIHRVGREARARLDECREQAAQVLGCKASELVFTSGGTESNNLAISGTARLLRHRGRHLITSAAEHHAVLACFQHLAAEEGYELTLLPVDSGGRVDPHDLQCALRDDTILVSIMAANNETGTIQPVKELASVCRSRGVVFHTDAVQWFGKLPFSGMVDFDADLLTLCAHKFHGPKGSGLLYIRSPLRVQPLIFGGPQENERRPGTENLAAIAGLVKALQLFVRPPVFCKDLLAVPMRRILSALTSIPGVCLQGNPEHCLPNTASFTVEGADGTALVAALDLEGICASSGSACSSGALVPSHVLLALGVPRTLASCFVRFSLGRSSTLEEADALVRVFPGVVSRIRSASAQD